METNIFILHGSFGNPFENWLPSTYAALSANGITTIVPQFPTPKGQNFDSWSAVLDGYRHAGILNEASVIVAHSSACPFIVKYANRKNCQFTRLVSISGFNNYVSGMDEFDSINLSFYQSDEELDLSKNHFVRIDSIYSDNDPYVPLETLKAFARTLGATHHLLPGGGHFNLDAGFEQFPDLIQLLKD